MKTLSWRFLLYIISKNLGLFAGNSLDIGWLSPKIESREPFSFSKIILVTEVIVPGLVVKLNVDFFMT